MLLNNYIEVIVIAILTKRSIKKKNYAKSKPVSECCYTTLFSLTFLKCHFCLGTGE